MHQVEDEPVETIHLYVVREGEKRPSLIPVIISVFALSILIAIGILTPYKQPGQRASIRVPAVLLPMRVFSAQIAIIPTGVKTYPATYAHGFLTFSNGSVIGQSIPEGFTIDGAMTDRAINVPPATANSFGMSTVPAHLLTSGINKSTLSINQVVGTSLFIRNLSPFIGGRAAYTVKFITSNDRNVATSKVRAFILSNIAQVQAFLASPCKEIVNNQTAIVNLIVNCQFAVYHIPSYMRVLEAKFAGRDFLVTVEFIPRPQKIWVK